MLSSYSHWSKFEVVISKVIVCIYVFERMPAKLALLRPAVSQPSKIISFSACRKLFTPFTLSRRGPSSLLRASPDTLRSNDLLVAAPREARKSEAWRCWVLPPGPYRLLRKGFIAIAPDLTAKSSFELKSQKEFHKHSLKLNQFSTR